MLERVNEKLGGQQKIAHTIRLMYSLKSEGIKHNLSVNQHEPVLLNQEGVDPLFLNRWICVTTLDSICDGFSSYGESRDQAAGGLLDFCYLLFGLRRKYDFFIPGVDVPLEDVFRSIIDADTSN